jgi:ATP-dependent helicase/nuclease subunit B
MIFDGPAPRWFSIDAHRPFLADLARVLFDTLASDDPAGLAEAIVFTPTRRGARALAEAFVVAAGGRAVLLPQILALGDLEEGEPPFEPGDLALDLPPAITPLRRRFELARLVNDHAAAFAPALQGQGALSLADALADFLDSAAIEEATLPSDPAALAPEMFADHWKVSAAALRVATELWPKRLRALGLMDVAARRTALLRALTEQWTKHPPERPLIAAGSTGSVPATAALLAAIANAPRGLVVLPGLDRDLADSAWAEVRDTDGHPQAALRRLLDHAEVARRDVRTWPLTEPPGLTARGRFRRRLVNEALRPADTTRDWLAQIATLREEGHGVGADPIAEGLAGLTLVEAHAEEEAATAIALLMREALETPGRTAALVTPDAALARRVSARLARWRIEADSSAGRPLSQTPVGVLLGLIAHTVAEGFDPPSLLALLKHPLVALAEGRSEALRTLERRGLRGTRPRGWAGLIQRLQRPRGEREAEERPGLNAALGLASDLEAALALAAAPFAEGAANPALAAEDLARAVEALAPNAWNGQAGEAASALMAQLMRDAAVLILMPPAAFAELVRESLDGVMVRPGGALHPRLSILGAIEARLVRADLLILAGLEEGVWPRLPPQDPFFSRPMRKTIGLAPPERRIGLSAHDFAQAASAPEVVLVTTERRGGQPAVRSRWLWRLATLARGAGLALPTRPEVLDWARALDAPLDPAPPELQPAQRPRPTPPLEARPRELPVTSVERWVRDPYSIYARNILGLRTLDPPDTPMDARARGTAIHGVFQRFAEAHEAGLSPGAELFETLMLQALEAEGAPEAAMARERALARRLAAWVVDEFEAVRRPPGRRFLIETQGMLKFPVDGAEFTVTAKADRIELEGGFAHVLDFKTGAAATKKQMDAGLSPQLTLTAAILMHGGFESAGPMEPGELLYVRVTGRRIPGQVLNPLKSAATRAEAERALAGLASRIRRFNDPNHPYRSWTAPQYLNDRGGGDYDHLARVFEWHVTGAGEEGGE